MPARFLQALFVYDCITLAMCQLLVVHLERWAIRASATDCTSVNYLSLVGNMRLVILRHNLWMDRLLRPPGQNRLRAEVETPAAAQTLAHYVHPHLWRHVACAHLAVNLRALQAAIPFGGPVIAALGVQITLEILHPLHAEVDNTAWSQVARFLLHDRILDTSRFIIALGCYNMWMHLTTRRRRP